MVHVAISVVYFSFLTTFIGLSHASASLWLAQPAFLTDLPSPLCCPPFGENPCLVCLLAIRKAFQKAIPLTTVILAFIVRRPFTRCTSKLWALYTMFLTSFVRPCIRKRTGGEFHIGIHNMYSLHVCIVTVWILFLLYLQLCTVIARWQERGGGGVPTFGCRLWASRLFIRLHRQKCGESSQNQWRPIKYQFGERWQVGSHVWHMPANYNRGNEHAAHLC